MYKEIKIIKEPTEVVEDTVEVELSSPKDLEDEVVEQPEPQKKEVQKVVEQEDKPKQPNRAEKRIRELNAKANEFKAMLEQKERELEELRKQMTESNKSVKLDLKKSLEDQIKQLSQAHLQAMKDGDFDRVAELTDKLMDLRIELRDLNNKATQQPESPPRQAAKPQQPQIPEKVQDWLDEHPEFFTDNVFNAAAQAVNNYLLSNGYTVEDQDFYDELNARLSKRFPEYFGMDKEIDVRSNRNYEPSQDVKPRSREQTVASSTRSPIGQATKSAKGSDTVHLTRQEIQYAEAMGLDLNQFARTKQHIERNSSDSGYVVINTQRR